MEKKLVRTTGRDWRVLGGVQGRSSVSETVKHHAPEEGVHSRDLPQEGSSKQKGKPAQGSGCSVRTVCLRNTKKARKKERQTKRRGKVRHEGDRDRS